MAFFRRKDPRRSSSAAPLSRLKWKIAALLLALALAPVFLMGLYRFVAPPLTPLMVIRLMEGESLKKEWVDLDEISPHLLRAVIASEDAKFCRHSGFDWDAIADAIDSYAEGGRVLGASTISMQTSKNLFLWPGRDFLRKSIEAPLTAILERLWTKDRIIEVYLNIIEWGPGIYGAEAASQQFFNRPAKSLTEEQAAALAAVLPNPRLFSPVSPSRMTIRKIETIKARMRHINLAKGGAC